MSPSILKKIKDQPWFNFVVALLAGLSGFLLNTLPIELFYKVWIFFGSIPALIVTLTLGPLWGSLTALIASSYTVYLWNSFHGVILYTLEALVLGSLIRQQRSPIIMDMFYWILIGSPLTYWFYTSWLGYSKIYVSILWVGLILNGFINIALAKLLLLLFPGISLSISGGKKSYPSEGLQSYLFVTFVIVAITPVAVMSLVNSRSLIKSKLEERKNNLKEISNSVSISIDKYLKLHMEGLQTLVKQLESRKNLEPSPEIENLIETAYKEYQGFSAVYLADASGQVMVIKPGSSISEVMNFSSRDYYKQLVQTKNTTISEVFFAVEGGFEPTVVIVSPILDEKGQMMAFIGGTLNLKVINHFIDRFKTDKNREIIVVDERNRVISSSNPKRYWALKDLENTELMTQALKEESEVFQYRLDEVKERISPESAIRLVGFQILRPLGWKVFIEQSLQEIYSEIQVIYQRLAFWIFGICGFSVLISILLSRTISRPIKELEAEAKSFISNLGNRKVSSRSLIAPTEVTTLARAFSEMAQEIEGSYSKLERMVKERTEELETKNFELQQMNKKLEEINRLKSAFLANMSHELRTPLNSILSLSEGLIRKIPGELNPDQEKYLKIIFKNGKDLLELINDLLDLAKIEAGKMKLNHRVFVVNRLIEEVVEIIYPMTQEKGLHFFVEVDTSTPPVIYSDEEKIKRIILNLASNAVKFTEKGLVVLGIKKCLREDIQRPYIQFSVSDTGIGISKEHQEAIFGEFIQVDTSRARRYQGAGLGLAISKKLVQILEGEIWLNSEPAEGSTFVFTIPTCEDQISPEALAYILEGEKNVEARFRKFELRPKNDQGRKVLLIEDVIFTQYAIKFLLATRDIQVIIPDHRQEEFYKNLEVQPDLILVDVSIPNRDGHMVLKAFREIQTFKEIPILAITSGPKEEQGSKWIKIGYNDYITKPIQDSDLLNKVTYWLNSISC